MKKIFQNSTLLVALLFCSSTPLLLTGCNPHGEQRDYSKDIIGKWKLVKYNGHDIETNNRTVFTFNEDYTGSQTEAAIDSLDVVKDPVWRAAYPLAYSLDGEELTTQWLRTSDSRKWSVPKIRIENGRMYTDPSTLFVNSSPTAVAAAEYQSVTDIAHYAEDIIGTWIGKSGSGGAYGDIDHQWVYLANRSYRYLSRNEKGEYVQDPGDIDNEYILDGDFFMTKWENNTGKHREAWDVTMYGNEMVWRGLRANGKRDSFFLQRITPVRQDIEAVLTGKWRVLLQGGDTVFTNERSVHTFDGDGKVNYTVAEAGPLGSPWENQTELQYTLMGNDLTEIGKSTAGKEITYHSQFMNVSQDRLEINSDIGHREGLIVLERDNTTDQEHKILGFWEGVSMTGPGTYGGAENQAWEYFNDGTYKYYTKVWNEDEGRYEWIEQAGEHDYLVDGKYFACRWPSQERPGEMDCEWWDLTFSEGDNPQYMYWDGYRIDPETQKPCHNKFVIKRGKR